jgi:hypothetical protein
MTLEEAEKLAREVADDTNTYDESLTLARFILRAMPVLRAAGVVAELRVKQHALSDYHFDQLDGPVEDALSALDQATAKLQGGE